MLTSDTFLVVTSWLLNQDLFTSLGTVFEGYSCNNTVQTISFLVIQPVFCLLQCNSSQHKVWPSSMTDHSRVAYSGIGIKNQYKRIT